MKNTLESFITEKRSNGIYTFSIEEVKNYLGSTYNNVKQVLYGYKKRNKIASVRQGFNVIITPEYSKSKILPAYLFLDDMMKWLKRDYYIGLFSAASVYGATHYQIMENYIFISGPPMRNIKKEKLSLKFITIKYFNKQQIRELKTEAGYVNISTPELTALDLMGYLENSSLERNIEIIKQFANKIVADRLFKAASVYPQRAAIQRLGYVFDELLRNKKLADSLASVIDEKKWNYIPLSPHNERKGITIEKWKIIKNINPEIEI
ncbi:MAG: type IV toxin-antitoxin system AbiEi family antitoxin [Vulcanibacillus sp.]